MKANNFSNEVDPDEVPTVVWSQYFMTGHVEQTIKIESLGHNEMTVGEAELLSDTLSHVISAAKGSR